jgi:hypothetical protein
VRLFLKLGTDLLSYVVARPNVLDATAPCAMRPRAVRASALFVLHANACATAYAATPLFVNRALPVSSSWLTLVSAAEVLLRLVVLWTTQWQ